MATLPLPDAPEARVFRKIVEILRADSTLQGVSPAWSVGRFNPRTEGPFVSPPGVGIRLRPEVGPASWYSPDAQIAALIVHVFIEIAGYDEDDLLNLWGAIVHALYPGEDPALLLGIQADLRAAGAETGLALFRAANDTDPASPDDGRFRARGEIRIEVVKALNP